MSERDNGSGAPNPNETGDLAERLGGLRARFDEFRGRL